MFNKDLFRTLLGYTIEDYKANKIKNYIKKFIIIFGTHFWIFKEEDQFRSLREVLSG